MASDEARMLQDTADRLLRDQLADPEARPADGDLPAALWQAVTAAGLPLTLLPEDAGGLGIAAGEAWGVLAALGHHGAPAPISDTLLAARLAADHGIALPDGDGPLALALPVDTPPSATPDGKGWQVTGTVRVPGGRHARATLALADAAGAAHLVMLPLDGLTPAAVVSPGPDGIDGFELAGVSLPADALAPTNDPEAPLRAGAILRCVQMAGALARVLELTVGYAQDRVQFGRPLAKFQAIQQQVAELAAEAALATAAARRALDLLDRPGGASALFEVAAAKSQCGVAATRAAAIAHQVHGAIGFTREYELQHLTRRLWAWREEFGSEVYWQRRLGAQVAAAGEDDLWPTLART